MDLVGDLVPDDPMRSAILNESFLDGETWGCGVDFGAAADSIRLSSLPLATSPRCMRSVLTLILVGMLGGEASGVVVVVVDVELLDGFGTLGILSIVSVVAVLVAVPEVVVFATDFSMTTSGSFVVSSPSVMIGP